MFVKKVLTIQL